MGSWKVVLLVKQMVLPSHPVSAMAGSCILLWFKRNFSVHAVAVNTHPPCKPQIRQPKQSTAQIICRFWPLGCNDPVACTVQLFCLYQTWGYQQLIGFIALAGMCGITFFSNNREYDQLCWLRNRRVRWNPENKVSVYLLIVHSISQHLCTVLGL